jgi:putative inorganic carbon (hco3(-)) transporter
VTSKRKTKAAPSPATVADLVHLEPRAYLRVFLDESLAFKVACLYLMFEYVRPQSIWTFIDILPYAMLSLVGGVALVMFQQDSRRLPVHGSKLILLLVFLAHILLTIVLSRYPDIGYRQLSTMIAWILAYILISKTVNTPQRMIFFYMLFLLFSFKMSQHGFKAWLQWRCTSSPMAGACGRAGSVWRCSCCR